MTRGGKRVAWVTGGGTTAASAIIAAAVVIALVVWKFIGFQVVVLLVGLQSIPAELYEAAQRTLTGM